MQKHAEYISSLFSEKGGEFILSTTEIKIKLSSLKALILDWDGVFNDGIKANNEGSPFSEIDSMGLNMLRFSFYLKQGFVPAIFIVTGENNLPALRLSKREHFNGVYIKMKNKAQALKHLGERFNLANDETGFVFDDILDLCLAKIVSLRFYVKRNSNPLLNEYITDNKLGDYYAANIGGDNAVREICELCIGLQGNYDEVVNQRVEFSSLYQDYLLVRNAIDTQYFTLDDGQITDYSFVS